MSIKIFDVDNSQVTINENCLLIPELKAVCDGYEDPIPPLSFLYFMTDPQSPYYNLPEDAREEIVLQDYPGDYTTEDEVIIEALKKLNTFYETPTKRLFIAAKISLDRLADYLSMTEIRDGKDGNLAEIYRYQTGLPKLVASFKELERFKDDEEGTARGGAEIGYDET